MFRTENVPGLNLAPKIRALTQVRAVEEHSLHSEAGSVRTGGEQGREDVGISSIKAGENPAHRKPKVSWATQIVPGLVGPKVSH